MKKKTEYEEETEHRPSYFLCGAGGDVNCPHFDDVEGCLCNSEYFRDDKCDAPADIEVEEEDEDYL